MAQIDHLTQLVLEAHGQRRVVDAELRRAMMPLALQEETTRLRSALDSEVELRQKAEKKLAKLQRQFTAVDAQRQQALERSSRMLRERKHHAATSHFENITAHLRRLLDAPSSSWQLFVALVHWRCFARHNQSLTLPQCSTDHQFIASPLPMLWESQTLD